MTRGKENDNGMTRDDGMPSKIERLRGFPRGTKSQRWVMVKQRIATMAEVICFLVKGPRTRGELVELTGKSKAYIGAVVSGCREHGLIYVSGWRETTSDTVRGPRRGAVAVLAWQERPWERGDVERFEAVPWTPLKRSPVGCKLAPGGAEGL